MFLSYHHFVEHWKKLIFYALLISRYNSNVLFLEQQISFEPHLLSHSHFNGTSYILYRNIMKTTRCFRKNKLFGTFNAIKKNLTSKNKFFFLIIYVGKDFLLNIDIIFFNKFLISASIKKCGNLLYININFPIFPYFI